MTWTSVVVLALAAALSCWTARLCARSWSESGRAGGRVLLLAWCGAVASALGLLSVLLLAAPHLLRPSADPALWYPAVGLPLFGALCTMAAAGLLLARRARGLVELLAEMQ